jgi:hypothetical protein
MYSLSIESYDKRHNAFLCKRRKQYVMDNVTKLREIRYKWIQSPNGGQRSGGQGVDYSILTT